MISYQFAVLFSAIPSLIFIIVYAFIRLDNETLKDKNSNLEKSNKSLEYKISSLNSELTSIKDKNSKFYQLSKGSKGLISGFPLEWTSTKKSFKVDYEVDILDVSTSKVKVNAFNFITSDKQANDPKHKQDILSYFKDKWVNIGDVSLILNESAILRNKKLDEILN